MYAKSKSTAAVHADGNANHPDDEQRGIYQTCTAQTFFVSQVAEFLITVTTPGRGCFVSGAMARNACASMRTASDVGHQSVDCEIPRMQLITDHENEPTAQIVEAASAVFSSLILLSRGESVDVGDVTLRLGEPIRSGNFEYQYYARDLAMPGGDYTHAPSGTQTRPDLDELFEQDIVFTETGPDPDLPPFRRAAGLAHRLRRRRHHHPHHAPLVVRRRGRPGPPPAPRRSQRLGEPSRLRTSSDRRSQVLDARRHG